MIYIMENVYFDKGLYMLVMLTDNITSMTNTYCCVYSV